MTAHITGTREELLPARLELLQAEKALARVTVRASDWLCLAAAPTFAIMALLTALIGGQPDILCSAAQHTSPLSGMIPMYLLMSAFHSAPWLKLISSRRNGALAVDLTHEGGM